MTKNKLNTVLKIFLSSTVIVALSGCNSWDKAPDTNTTAEVEQDASVVEVAQNSNAILEPIEVLKRGYDYIEILSSGVDEDGIDNVTFYAISNGTVKSRKTKKINGDVSFDIQLKLTGLKDNTVYELRTVCYSVDGKTKSIEKHSVKTFAKTQNDPSNDKPIPSKSEPVVEAIPTPTPTPLPVIVDKPTPKPTPIIVDVPTPDTQAPVMTLKGQATITLDVGDTYTEQGVTVTDNVDTGLTATIWGDTVDTSTAGTYTVTYNVRDEAGNVATEVSRTVKVESVVTPNKAPEILKTGPFIAVWLTNTITIEDIVKDDWDLSKLTLNANPTQGTLVYNKDWSVTYTRTDWDSWNDDVFEISFFDWEKTSKIVEVNFEWFDDE